MSASAAAACRASLDSGASCQRVDHVTGAAGILGGLHAAAFAAGQPLWGIPTRMLYREVTLSVVPLVNPERGGP